MAVVEYQKIDTNGDGIPDTWYFDGVEGYAPVALPGGLTVGEVSGAFVDTSNGPTQGQYTNVNAGSMGNFTTMTVIFDPDGQLTAYNNVGFNPRGKMIHQGGSSLQDLWFLPAVENSVSALCICNGKELDTALAGGDVNTWLNEYAQFLPVNRYTGGLIRGAKQ